MSSRNRRVSLLSVFNQTLSDPSLIVWVSVYIRLTYLFTDILQKSDACPWDILLKTSSIIDCPVTRDRFFYRCNWTTHWGLFLLSVPTCTIYTHGGISFYFDDDLGRRRTGNIRCTSQGQQFSSKSSDVWRNPRGDNQCRPRESVCYQERIKERLIILFFFSRLTIFTTFVYNFFINDRMRIRTLYFFLTFVPAESG